MKRMALAFFALILAAFLVNVLGSCAQQSAVTSKATPTAPPAPTPTVASPAVPTPTKVPVAAASALAAPVATVAKPAAETLGEAPGAATELPRDIAFLHGVSNQGNLLVSLWQGEHVGKEIYQYDVTSKTTARLVAQSDPELITNADVSLFNSYLLWEEARPVPQGSGWKLHLRNLETGDDSVIAQDDLGVLEKTVLVNVAPYRPSIYGTYVAWSQLTRNGNTFDSQIFLYDVRTKQKRVIAGIEGGGLDSVLQTPQLFGNSIVWNKVSYDMANLVAHADVYLFDIETGKERRLTDNGKSFAPVISDSYVAWQYRSTPEDVYGQIELYDLGTDQLTRLTDGKPHEENWDPTIGSRLVTWQPGLADKVRAYDLRSKRLLVLDTGYVKRVFTNGNTIAWQWNEPADRINPLDRRIKYVLLPASGPDSR